MTPGENQPKTVEEYQALLKLEQEEKETMKLRAIKAEKVIENKKKEAKDDPKDPPAPGIGEDAVRKILAEDDFYKKNPELVDHKARISELTQAGCSLDVAKLQVESEDPTIANREKARKSNFTDGDAGGVKKTITQEELSELPQEDFVRMHKLSKEGKVKII